MRILNLYPLICIKIWLNIRVRLKVYKVKTDDTNSSLNWYEADKYCQHIGGHLSSFKSYNSIYNVLRGQSVWSTGPWNYVPFWIGLNRVDKNEGK